MLHILLLLLKIIGIIILCILGTIIIVLLCVLFVPVRYRIEVARKEGENEPPVVVQAKVTWLFHFLNVLVRYSTEFYLRVRLLFIPVFRLPKKERNKAGKRKKKEKREEAKEEEREKKREEKVEEREKKREEKVEEREEKPEEAVEEKEKIKAKQEKKNIGKTAILQRKRDEKNGKDIPRITVKRKDRETEQNTGFTKAAEEAEPQNFVYKLRALWEKIQNFIENIQYTIRNICDKIKAVYNDIQYYSDLVRSDVFQGTYILCKKELCRLLKGILPGIFKADLVVGTDDPAATGQILAVCGMLYPILGEHINVVGDFEEKRLEGRIFMKGRIYGITLIYTCVKIYFNKNVKKLYKLLKKEAV